MSFAELVLTSKTEGLLKGKKALEETTKAGADAEKATRGTRRGFDEAGAGASNAAPRVDRFSDATDRTREIAIDAKKAIAGLVLGFLSVQTAMQAVGSAKALNAALGETNTLISGMDGEIDKVAASARNLADAYGTSDEQQVRGFYQAISAGAGNAAEATEILHAANMLAIGGVTDVTTGVDALTTAVNAYGPDVLSAAEASDLMFIAMKAGKTTIGELSASLGNIVPLASAAGITFGEVTAGISALTTQGLSTSAATTGLRQVIAGVIKPTKEATDAAEALGIEFSTQAIKAKGLGGFLEDIVDKTGGSEVAMSKLFGSVEALGAVLAFSGGAAESFTGILEANTNAAGAAAEAMAAIDATATDRIDDAMQSLSNTLTRLAELSLPMLAAAAEAAVMVVATLAGSGDVLTVALQGAAVALVAITATQIPAAITGFLAMTAGMTASSLASGVLSVATGVLTAAIARARLALIALGGPIGIVYGLIGAAAAAFLVFDVNAGVAETASYDAAEGSSALAAALGAVTSAEPAASAAVIALANNNIILADSAYEAAKAELAKRRAMMDMRESSGVGGTTGSIRDTGITETTNTVNAALAARTSAEKALEQAINDRTVASEQVAMSMPVVRSSTDALGDSSRTAAEAAALLAETLAETGGAGSKAAKGMGAAAKGVDAASESLEQATKEADALKDALERPLLGAIDGMANAFGDFVASGMRDFEDFGKAILSSITSAISQAVAFAVANPIKIAMGLTGGLTGGAASAGQVAQGAAGGGGGILSSLGAGGGLVGSAVSGGAGLVTSMMGGGGLASAGTYMGSVMAGATTSMAGFAAAAGAVALPLLAVAAVFSFFKKSTKELDAGLRFTVEGMDTLVQSFSKTETKRFWGLSKKERTSFNDLSAEDADPLTSATNAIQGSVVDAANQLGFAAETFDGFSHQFTVSLKGLDDAAKQAAIADALAGLGDAMAGMVEGLGDDGMYDELLRLASALTSVNQTFDTLGRTLLDTSLAGGKAAAQLAEMAGGLDNLTAFSRAYYDGFYSDAERFATAQRQIGDQFAALNMVMPASRDGFREMVEAVDVTTESGRALYVSLLSMAGALDTILPSVHSFTSGIAAMVASVTTEIDMMVTGTTEAMRANEQAATLWYRTASSLRAFISDMRGSAGALVSAGQARAYSEARFQSLLTSALAGNNQAATDLTGAARTLLDNTRDTATSSLELARAEARVLSGVQMASGVSSIEGARHDVIAGLLGQQITLLGTLRDAINSGDPLLPEDIAGLNGQLGDLAGTLRDAINSSNPLSPEDFAGLSSQLGDLAGAIAPPMDSLRKGLNNLVVAINDDAAERAKSAERTLKLVSLQTQLSAQLSTKDLAMDQASNLVAQIRELEKRTGVTIMNGAKLANFNTLASGSTAYQATNVSYGSGADLDAFSKAFWSDGGLEDQLRAIRSKPGAMNQGINALRAQISGLGAVPSYAMGTDFHAGGVARVGERGAEYVDLPRGARVNTASASRSMGNTEKLERLVEKLTTEVARMRDENTQLVKNGNYDLRRIRLIEERRESEAIV